MSISATTILTSTPARVAPQPATSAPDRARAKGATQGGFDLTGATLARNGGGAAVLPSAAPSLASPSLAAPNPVAPGAKPPPRGSYLNLAV